MLLISNICYSTIELSIEVKEDIKISWESSGTNFIVYRSTSKDIIGERITRKPIKEKYFIDKTADYDKIYYYRVESLDENNKTLELSQPTSGYVNPYRSIVTTLPTAYREKTNFSGINLTVLLTYYIGKIYANNKIHERYEPEFLSRTGLWLAVLDFKIVPFTEFYFPFTAAVGARYSYFFTDVPPPGAGIAEQALTFRVGTGKNISALYLAVGKKIYKTVVNLGCILGKEGDCLSYLFSDRVRYYQKDIFENIFFINLQTKIVPFFPFKMEFIIPIENELSFMLINTDFTATLPLGFQLSFLTYNDGFCIQALIRFHASVISKP